jgi:hypothetical protein
MSRFQQTLLVAVGLLAVLYQVAMSTPVQGEEADGIVFHEDYNQALREAKRTKQPIFLEFRCAP